MSYRAALTVIVALILGVLVVGGVAGTPSAEAQTQTPTIPDTVPQEWVDAYKKTVKATESPDPAKRNAARRILTRSAAKVGGSRFLGVGTKLGLAGAAVGTWAVVGYELKYALESGSSESIATNLSLAPAPGALYGSSQPNASYGGASLFITRMSWSVDSGRYSYSAASVTGVESWVYRQFSSQDKCNTSTGRAGVRNVSEYGRSLSDRTYTSDCPAADFQPISEIGPFSSTINTTQSYRVFGEDLASDKVTVTALRQGPELCKSNGCAFVQYFPTVATGPSTLPDSLPGPDYSTTVSEGNQVIQEVVTDPEAPTVIPDAPPDWDDLPDPPADPNYDPDAPENDPDPDRPVWEPDPYGDPASPLYDPDSPNADPDQDGIPNKDDPDDDNDGIPDEQDPRPTQPGPYPDDHPEADPDKDGIPNKDDPDDDNDGIPDEQDPNPQDPTNPDLDPSNPNADPDGDGIPNKDDPDDDNDGVPDELDPAPYDPAKPGDDPTFDGDGDGVPFKIDPNDNDPSTPPEYTKTDTDGDGSPDTYDPAPYDPALPDGGPGGDPDGDGVPNRHDPFPTNPTYPQGSPSEDLDQDGQPNAQDPDPYRQSEPQGGPDADPDNDGVPNSSDPAPNDPDIPQKNDGDVCPIPPKPNFELPEIESASVFPFSLILRAWSILGALIAPPEAPTFDIPGLGLVTPPPSFDPMAATIRVVIGLVSTVGMAFWFYRYISGKGSE